MTFLKKNFISFDDFIDIELEKNHFYHSPWLVLYLKDQMPIILNTQNIPNHKKMLNLITKHKIGGINERNLIFATKRFYGRFGYYEIAIPIECKGSGTEDDPHVIDETYKLLRSIYFLNHTSRTILRKVNSKRIYLDKCKNFTIENCNLNLVKLYQCENLFLKNNRIKKLKNIKGKNNTFDSNLITKLNSNVIETSFQNRNILTSNNIHKSDYGVKKRSMYI